MELGSFQRYIEEHNFVAKEKSSYYVAWVRRFLQMRLSETLSSKDKIARFVENLALDKKLEQWQREQGKQAVELFLNMFAGNVQKNEINEDLPNTETLPQMTSALRLKHYAYRTERTYIDWVKRYLKYCVKQRLNFKKSSSVKLYLTFLTVNKKVASSTQNQAFNSILFLFRNILGKDLADIKDTVRAKGKKNIPAVLSVDEIKRLFAQLEDNKRMILELIYGTGLRISELTRLRVMSIDFDNYHILVKDGKGGKDRIVPLPKKLEDVLRVHLARVKVMHNEDLAMGYGEVYLPEALSRKYSAAGREWSWQYVFPAPKLAVDPRSGKVRRHHILDQTVQKLMKKAVRSAGIVKKASVHTLRHSFATHLLMSGVNIREIQELLGHKNIETTMIYTHIMRELSETPRSPLDML